MASERMEETISFRGLEKKFGEKHAVKPLTAEWRRGEVTALLGPNGAGKSTLVSMLLGLRRPTAGSVSAFGMEPGSRPFRERVGALLQEAKPADGLRVRETLELFRALYPRPLTLARLLSIAGLEREASRTATSLSGGQRRRLAFALSMAGDPDLLVLDEPTVGMDIESRDRFWDTIRALSASGKTVLLTTHHLEEADAVADRVVVIADGQVLADGAPATLKTSASLRSVVFDAPEGAQAADWSSLPGVERVERQGGRVRLYASDTDAVLLALVRGGRGERNIEVREPSLEEAFRALTAKGGEGA
ncbi:ABC transporter ATP-binding protein [Paenibacillus antri]|nr:ABC transporter ATP-binding protein [Paenibacillus antri]